jgi:hypothetical protein
MRPASKADFTAIYEPIVSKMWEPRRLTTPWASTACYRDRFTFFIINCYKRGVSLRTCGRTSLIRLVTIPSPDSVRGIPQFLQESALLIGCNKINHDKFLLDTFKLLLIASPPFPVL